MTNESNAPEMTSHGDALVFNLEATEGDAARKPINTNKKGGTRYSVGKPNALWSPLLGLICLDLGPSLSELEECLGSCASNPTALNVKLLGLAVLGELCPDPREKQAAFHALSAATECGSEKYAPHDWYVGQDFSILLNSAIRHVWAYVQGDDVDDESGLPVLWHALWNLCAIETFLAEEREDLDDVGPFLWKTTEEV